MQASVQELQRMKHADSSSAAAADDSHPALEPRSSPGYVWYVIALLTVVNAVNYMDRMALATLAPSIKSDLGLSDGQLGLLTGLAFAVFYAICGVPIARWADTGIRRNVIAIALATWSAMTAVSAAAQNFWHLFLARVGVGAGEAGGPAPAGSLLCDYVTLKRRPLVFAIHAAGLTAGMVLGMALAGWLAEEIGWRGAFLVLGLPGLVLAVIVRTTLREPPRGVYDAVKEGHAGWSFGQTLEFLWGSRAYRLIVTYMVLNGFVQYGLNQWWPSLYFRVFELSLSSVGINLGLAIGIGSGLGTLLGGILANKVAERDVVLPLKWGAAAIGLAAPVALGTIMLESATASIVLVSATVFLLGVPSGTIVANVFSVVMPRMRAMAGAVAMFATSLLGFGLGPFCVGLLSDFLAPSFGEESLRYALLPPIALLPVMAFSLWSISKALPEGLRAAGAAGPVP